MSYPTAKLRNIAPPETSRTTLGQRGKVWLLNLDQIEKDTGRILSRQFTDAEEASASTAEFDTRHVLYSKLRPNLNKVVCPDQPGYATTELVRLVPDQNRVLREYLTYYLRSNYFVDFATRCVAGAKMPRMVMDEFWQHEMPTPSSRMEQARIVELLHEGDELRAQKNSALTLARRLLQEVFREAFPLWERVSTDLNLDDLFEDVSRLGARVQTKEYKASGRYPIIDQGENEIAGFTDDQSLLFQGSLPVVLFGDHTRIFKYVDKPFCMGADGLRVLSPRPGYAPEFAFQQCATLNIPSAGYSRHFKYLKEQRFFKGSSSAQERFAKVFQTTRSALGRVEQSASMLETLFKTLLQRAFDGRLTAKWREAHAKELLEEMHLQSRA